MNEKKEKMPLNNFSELHIQVIRVPERKGEPKKKKKKNRGSSGKHFLNLMQVTNPQIQEAQ